MVGRVALKRHPFILRLGAGTGLAVLAIWLRDRLMLQGRRPLRGVGLGGVARVGRSLPEARSSRAQRRAVSSAVARRRSRHSPRRKSALNPRIRR